MNNPKAQKVLDWVEVAAYIFWVVFAAVLALVALFHGLTVPIDIRIPR